MIPENLLYSLQTIEKETGQKVKCRSIDADGWEITLPETGTVLCHSTREADRVLSLWLCAFRAGVRSGGPYYDLPIG